MNAKLVLWAEDVISWAVEAYTNMVSTIIMFLAIGVAYSVIFIAALATVIAGLVGVFFVFTQIRNFFF